ncbi:zinc finger protein 879 [Aedes aegypti]|uniref:C2H2-type domain-containing protein n=1 Tax=Aedes aegypti TaxID=7159 RepID=A0A1S4FHQ9_AEDAE|nr:zinc finger protein 879 [Aedes aegypti]
MDSASNVLEIPEGDPTKFCRVCLSRASYSRVLSCRSEAVVEAIWKQLGVRLSEPDDFPCAVCAICVEKLEELVESNSDGLLDQWGDEGLLEYKNRCRAVDAAIRSRRTNGQSEHNMLQGTETVVLPFQQLNDGRYRCNDCPNVIFDAISVCIKHYQEDHPNSGLAGLSVESSASKQTLFNCTKCSKQFENVDEMTAHQKTHLAPKKRSAKKRTTEVTNGSHQPAESLNGKKPYLKCVNCTETFDDVDELISHRVTVHAIVIPKKKPVTKRNFIVSPYSTTCKACQIEFADKKALYMHINLVHDQNICHICDRTLNSASQLLKHQSFHRNLNDIVNPFLLGKHSFHCKVCFERFRSEGEIRLHFETKHTNSEAQVAISTPTTPVLRITCAGCLMSFNSTAQFEQHQLECCVAQATDSSAIQIE